MSTQYTLKKSKAKGKRFALVIQPSTGATKTVNFGSDGQNFTLHKDPVRKARYLLRHKVEVTKGFIEDTKQNLQRASYLSNRLLWNKDTLPASIADVERRQGIKIKSTV